MLRINLMVAIDNGALLMLRVVFNAKFMWLKYRNRYCSSVLHRKHKHSEEHVRVNQARTDNARNLRLERLRDLRSQQNRKLL